MNVVDLKSRTFFIQPKNVPERLKDVPLPVEVFGPDNELSWVIVQLREGGRTKVPANASGTYDLRAELPQGERVRLQIDISETGDQSQSVDLDLNSVANIRKEFRPSEAIQGTCRSTIRKKTTAYKNESFNLNSLENVRKEFRNSKAIQSAYKSIIRKKTTIAKKKNLKSSPKGYFSSILTNARKAGALHKGIPVAHKSVIKKEPKYVIRAHYKSKDNKPFFNSSENSGAALPRNNHLNMRVDISEAWEQPILLDLCPSNPASVRREKVNPWYTQVHHGAVIEEVAMVTRKTYSTSKPGSKLLGKEKPIINQNNVLFSGWLFKGWAALVSKEPENLCLRCKQSVEQQLMLMSQGTKLQKKHSGWTKDGRQRQPMLLKTRFTSYDHGTVQSSEALVVLPPAAREPTINFLSDPSPHPNPSAPHLLASVEIDFPAANALFSYVRGGSFEAARHAQPLVRQQTEKLLYDKETFPVSATVAAYALYRLGERNHLDWVKNLADWFKYMPDGAVIYGSHMIMEGNVDEAWKYFRIALDRGIPMYSEGLKLMCDGLVFLSGIFTNDQQVQNYATRSFSLAALANIESELTCLRLGSFFGL